MLIINNFLKLFTMIMTYHLIYQKSRKKHIFISVCIAAVIDLAFAFLPSEAFLATEIIDESNLIYYVLLNLLVICIYAVVIKFMHKDTFLNSVSKIIISFVIVLVPEYIVTFLSWLFKTQRGSVYLTVLLLSAFYLTLLITYNVRRHINMKKVELSLINIKIATMGMVSLGLIIIVVGFVNNEMNIENNIKIFLYVVLSCFIITSIVLATDIVHEMNEKNNLEMQCKYNVILEEYIEKIRATEHEYKNHLNVIYTMLDIGSDKEIREMARKYIDKNKAQDKITKLVYINNTILKAIVYSKMCEADGNGISFKHDIKSNLNSSSLKDDELVVILTNLLNNAIEAAKQSKEKFIELSINEEMKNEVMKYTIKVKNSAKDLQNTSISDMVKKGYSTKGVSRGYGLSNIKGIVNKHKGNIIFNVVNDQCLEVEVQI